ncbi:MAG: tRNA uridine(34) 5-carboxymethylaminomethyl modification radical SAM/GNAT enzyme Elp3 [archaeon]|nr:tRNA uridine(34) 5-carboxymethylaminomethyl modification radical SAM/GNAT enzyme Elp3 [archaeon]
MSEQEKIERSAHEIIKYLIDHPKFQRKKITSLKNRVIKKYHLNKTIKNSQIIQYANENELELILPVLRRRSTRSISGVTVVAVMTKPLECPGNCLFCPGDQSQPEEKAAKSYTGREPAAKRSIMYNYDSYRQTKGRLLDLKAIGHQVDKVEVICMGGTLLSAPEEYQRTFIKGCIDAINNFYLPDFNQDSVSSSLEEAMKKAESAKLRFIGLTIETRPDFCLPEHVNRMLDYGGTRVEIGIQTTRESILKNLNRGHTIQQSINAIRYAKDGGLKINAHMMPNLPGSTPKEDYLDFKELFNNSDFRPDMLKIYPTLVVGGTELHKMWENGKYESYPLETVVDLIAKVKSELPKYVRIQRIQRDIPADLIIDGVKKSNLRQIIQRKLEKMDKKCNCIRCREQGFIDRLNKSKNFNKTDEIFNLNDFKLQRMDYEASGGKEIFLSYESEKSLLGYLRLRKPSDEVFRPELKVDNTLIVREVRIVGQLVPKDNKPSSNQVQHRGYGQKLMIEAERIAKEDFDAKKISVISGIGVREYFYEQGYLLDGVYVSKKL